ncbi:MAG: heavy-metal-associated domain-containing protein [bacterium]|nr:heavy-metal-associated domain-containing protein [bacterium]
MKKTYNVTGLHCSSCPLVIEGELEDIGVQATCTYATAKISVEYDEATVTEEKIRETVKKAGYELTP